MENIQTLLSFLAVTIGVTLSGIFFSLATENWKEAKYNYLYLVITSVLLTPIGAWLISLYIKFNPARI